ncbi:MAG TPA: Holliday junction resolvase RuvX [Candidatus Hypogeohydataceae bacterium YC41]
MRILGIDYGKKRLGLALSDPLGLTAQPLGILECSGLEEDLEKLSQLIREKEVEEIVVGLPKRMDATLGKEAHEVLQFVENLKVKFNLPVHLIDERLTTAGAHKIMKAGGLSRKERTKRADTMAAQSILQIYLDKRSKGYEREANSHPG